jgi:hypothetical protein
VEYFDIRLEKKEGWQGLHRPALRLLPFRRPGGGGLMDCSFRPFDLHVIFFLKGHGIFLRIFIVEILECCVGG